MQLSPLFCLNELDFTVVFYGLSLTVFFFVEIEDSNSIGYLRHQLQELELNKSQQLKERDNRVATLETRYYNYIRDR